MKKAKILKVNCDKSVFCIVKRICPENAVSQKTKFLIIGETPKIDKERCTGCGKCVQYCPHNAIVIG